MSAATACPGSNQLPSRTTKYNMVWRNNSPTHPMSGWCGSCGREYVLNNDGLVRRHRCGEAS